LRELRLWLGVVEGDVGLEVEHRGAIDEVEPLHLQGVPIDATEAADRYGERVGTPATECERALEWEAIVARRVGLAARAELLRHLVHPPDHENVRVVLEAEQRLAEARGELDP